MELELERWAAVVEAPAYDVSTWGRVRRGDYAVASWPNKKGYHCVSLELPDARVVLRYVHQLVLEAFRGPRPGRSYQGNHDNGRKGDNRLENLYWTTPAGNVEHARRTGLIGPRRRRETCQHGHPLTQRYRQRDRAGAMREWLRCARCRRVRHRQQLDQINGFRSLLELLE